MPNHVIRNAHIKYGSLVPYKSVCINEQAEWRGGGKWCIMMRLMRMKWSEWNKLYAYTRIAIRKYDMMKGGGHRGCE